MLRIPVIDRSGGNQVPRITSSTISSASSPSQHLPGVRALKLRWGASSALRATASCAARVRANRSPRSVGILGPSVRPFKGWSVAERGGAIADPLPELDGSTEPGVGHERGLVELPGVEADRARQQLAAGGLE